MFFKQGIQGLFKKQAFFKGITKKGIRSLKKKEKNKKTNPSFKKKAGKQRRNILKKKKEKNKKNRGITLTTNISFILTIFFSISFSKKKGRHKGYEES